jgi:hypothetical protein
MPSVIGERRCEFLTSSGGAFVTCASDGRCIADFEATPKLVSNLKKGQMLQIQATNLAAKAITFPLLLSERQWQQLLEGQ